MTPDKIEEWALRAGAHKHCIHDNTAELAQFAEFVRAHAIEECALECGVAAGYYESPDRSDTAMRLARVFRSWLPGGR